MYVCHSNTHMLAYTCTYISTEMLNEDKRGHNDESKREGESKKAEEQEREREK